MAKKLSKTIKEFVSSPWDKMEVYKLTARQKKELLESKLVFKQKGVMPGGFEFGEHSHSLPQLLLAEKGFLTHFAKGKAFPQKAGELLVVPANFPHTAKTGEQELHIIVFHKVPKQEN